MPLAAPYGMSGADLADSGLQIRRIRFSRRLIPTQSTGVPGWAGIHPLIARLVLPQNNPLSRRQGVGSMIAIADPIAKTSANTAPEIVDWLLHHLRT